MTLQFKGPLATEFSRFAQQMLSSGGQHITLFATVRRLDTFLTRRHPAATVLTREVLADWLSSFAHLQPNSQSRYRCATFLLCKFLHGREPATATRQDFVPLRCQSSFRPHILSRSDVADLLQTARKLPARSYNPLRPKTIELAFVLLYTAGLRIGEVGRLRLCDYDPVEATLLIRETKFAKTRLVPLSPTARTVLDAYLHKRRRLGLSHLPTDSLLWPMMNGGPAVRISLGSLQRALVRVMRDSGLKPPTGRRGPRIHDIRHTFAVHRVVQWYREGVDVQKRLPQLSTYMGHRGIESTQLYLSVIPDVLQEASILFERLACRTASGEEVAG